MSEKIFQLSVSKAKTFDSCKAKYKFAYIDFLPKKDWEHTVFGSYVHEILENFYFYRINKEEAPNEALMEKARGEALESWKNKLNDDNIAEANSITSKYLELVNKEDSEGKSPNVLSVEDKFRIKVADKVLITGVIDRVQNDLDGTRHVIDYKTSKKESMKYMKKDLLQLETYAYVNFMLDETLEKVNGSYLMLRADLQSIKRSFNRKDTIEKIENYFIKTYEYILQEKLWLPEPTILCKWCDYMSNCEDGQNFVDELDGRASKFKKKKVSFGETNW